MADVAPVSVNYSRLHKAAEKLGLTTDDVNNVLELSMNDTATWANKEAAKQLAQSLKVPYRSMRKRVRAKKGGRGRDAKIWFGVNEVSLRYLNPKQNGGGVTTTAKTVPGAFIGGYKLSLGVFKRTGEKRAMKSGASKGKKREVIEKQTLDIGDQSIALLEGSIVQQVETYYMDRIIFHFGRAAGPEATPLNLK